MFKRHLVDSIYKADITLVVCTKDDLVALLRKRDPMSPFDPRDSDGKCIEHQWANGFIEWYVWLPCRWARNDAGVATIMHESMHAAFKILRHRGLTLSSDSEEAFTYYAESIFRTILRELDKRQKTGRKRPV